MIVQLNVALLTIFLFCTFAVAISYYLVKFSRYKNHILDMIRVRNPIDLYLGAILIAMLAHMAIWTWGREMFINFQLDMPLLIVLAFFLLTLVVGYYFSRQKITFREYAVGNKQFTTATLVATVMATNWGGGGLVRTVQLVHNLGLVWVVFMTTNQLSFWVASRLMVRMGPFMQNLSLPENIGRVYGKWPRVVASIFCILSSVVTIALQINVIKVAIGTCFESINPQLLTVAATLVVIFYSTFGGVRAVTFTDVLQLLTFCIVIPILAWFMFLKTDKSITEIAICLQNHAKFQSQNVFRLDKQFFGYFFLWLSSLISIFSSSANMQRIYMCADIIQAKKTFRYSGLFSLLLVTLIVSIGAFIFVAAPDLPVEEVWKYVYVNIPVVFKGFLAISLLAMAMSTADSNINACSVIISHDIMEVVGKPGAAFYTHQLRFSRWVSCAAGLLAMGVAFYTEDLLKLLSLVLDISLPVITAPLILALYGFRGTSRTALIGMGVGVGSIALWKYFIESHTGISGALPCMLLNGLAMLIAHYRFDQPDGVGWVEMDDAYWQIQHTAERQFTRLGQRVDRFFGLLNANILSKSVPQKNQLVIAFLYCLTMLLLSIVQHRRTISISLGATYLRQIIAAFLFAGAAFFQAPQKYNKLPKYAALKGFLWIAGLTYVLLIDMGWHWKYTTEPGFTAFLTFAHVGVFFYLIPFYTACYLTTIVSTVYVFHLMFLGKFSINFPESVQHTIGLGMVYLLLMIRNKSKLRVHQEKEERWSQKETYRAAQAEACYQHRREVALRTMGTTNPGEIHQVITTRMSALFNQYARTEQSSARRNHWVNTFIRDTAAYINQRLRLDQLAPIRPMQMGIYSDVISPVEHAISQDLSVPPRLCWHRPVVPPPQELKLPEHEVPLPQAPRNMVADPVQLQELLTEAIKFATQYDHAIGPERQTIRVEVYSAKLLHHKSALSNTKRRSAQCKGPLHDAEAPIYDAVVIWVGNQTILKDKRPSIRPVYFSTDSIQPTDGLYKGGSAVEERMRAIVDAHHGFLWCHPPAADQTLADNDDTDHLQFVPLEDSVLIVLPVDVQELSDQYGDVYTYLCVPTAEQQQTIDNARKAFLDYVSTDPNFHVKKLTKTVDLLQQIYCGKQHASGVLFFVRTLEIAELVIREWKDKPALFAAALGPKEVLTTDLVIVLLLYALHKQSFVTLEFLRIYCPKNVYRKLDATASLEATILSPNFLKETDRDQAEVLMLNSSKLTKKGKELFAKYKLENRLVALYIKLTEWYYDFTNAKGYTDQALLQKRIDQAHAFKLDLALAYFHGTTVAQDFQAKMLAAVMHACPSPVNGPLETVRRSGRNKDRAVRSVLDDSLLETDSVAEAT